MFFFVCVRAHTHCKKRYATHALTTGHYTFYSNALQIDIGSGTFCVHLFEQNERDRDEERNSKLKQTSRRKGEQV